MLTLVIFSGNDSIRITLYPGVCGEILVEQILQKIGMINSFCGLWSLFFGHLPNKSKIGATAHKLFSFLNFHKNHSLPHAAHFASSLHSLLPPISLCFTTITCCFTLSCLPLHPSLSPSSSSSPFWSPLPSQLHRTIPLAFMRSPSDIQSTRLTVRSCPYPVKRFRIWN